MTRGIVLLESYGGVVSYERCAPVGSASQIRKGSDQVHPREKPIYKVIVTTE